MRSHSESDEDGVAISEARVVDATAPRGRVICARLGILVVAVWMPRFAKALSLTRRQFTNSRRDGGFRFKATRTGSELTRVLEDTEDTA